MAERNRLLARQHYGQGSPEDDFAYGQGIPAAATWRNLIPFAEFGLGMSPGSGEAMSARDAWDASGRGGNALLRGNYGDAASEYLNMGTGLLGAIPGIGMVARGTKRGAAWMDRNLPGGFNRLLDAVYPSDPRSTTSIFAGPTAKTADHAALAKAQEMKAQGASRADIWREAGWDLEKADQIPRFEVDDSGSFYRGTSPATSTPAEEAFLHPEFYSAYPEAGKVKITEIPRPAMSEPRGSYSDFYNEIELAGRDKSSTTLHEMQHYVQDAEGFPQGSSQFEEMFNLDEVGSPEYRQLYADVFENLKYGSGNDPSFIEAVRRLDAMKSSESFDRYRRAAGEVEARNVQSRMNMTAAERRATPPWETQDVPDEQQIVRFR